MNGGNNRHNYGTYKIKNMLAIPRVENGHKLQDQLKTACFEVLMMTGFNKAIVGWPACHAEIVVFKLKAE